MTKKDDGTLSFKAAAEDFPQKHKAPILNIGIAETGTEHMKCLEVVLDRYLMYMTSSSLVTEVHIDALHDTCSPSSCLLCQ